jgi:hypothetical protein
MSKASKFLCIIPIKKDLMGDLSRTTSFLLNHIAQQKTDAQKKVADVCVSLPLY